MINPASVERRNIQQPAVMPTGGVEGEAKFLSPFAPWVYNLMKALDIFSKFSGRINEQPTPVSILPVSEPFIPNAGGVVEKPIFGKNEAVYVLDSYPSGNKHGFVIPTEDGGYKARKGFEELVGEVEKMHLLHHRTRAPEFALQRFYKTLSHPRAFLDLARYEGTPVAYAVTFRVMYGNEPIIVPARLVIEDHEANGIGPQLLVRGIQRHQAYLRFAHRKLISFGVSASQNPAAVSAIEKGEEEGCIYPLHVPYTANPEKYPEAKEAKQRMLAVHKEISLFLGEMAEGDGMDPDTGVSHGELRAMGANVSFDPRRASPRSLRIWQFISYPKDLGGLGANLPAGDLPHWVFKIISPEQAKALGKPLRLAFDLPRETFF